MEFATQWDLVHGTISNYNQSSKTIYIPQFTAEGKVPRHYNTRIVSYHLCPKLDHGFFFTDLSSKALFRGDPALMRGDPALMRGDPTLSRGDPTLSRGDPTLLRGDPTLLRGDPALMRGDPALLRGDPALMRGDPSLT